MYTLKFRYTFIKKRVFFIIGFFGANCAEQRAHLSARICLNRNSFFSTRLICTPRDLIHAHTHHSHQPANQPPNIDLMDIRHRFYELFICRQHWLRSTRADWLASERAILFMYISIHIERFFNVNDFLECWTFITSESYTLTKTVFFPIHFVH